jgi:hypothetical protein
VVLSVEVVSLSVVVEEPLSLLQEMKVRLKRKREKMRSIVLLQMELEKSISRVSHFLIVQLRCNFNFIFT